MSPDSRCAICHEPPVIGVFLEAERGGVWVRNIRAWACGAHLHAVADHLDRIRHLPSHADDTFRVRAAPYTSSTAATYNQGAA